MRVEEGWLRLYERETGRRLPMPAEVAEARRQAEARAEQEAEARRQAEARAEQEAEARRQAEARAQAAEDELARLRAELAHLRDPREPER